MRLERARGGQPGRCRRLLPPQCRAGRRPGRSGHVEDICSPMVGVFYAAPAEDAEPFVQVGDRVNKGDTLCMIEAMKLMNEITAEQDGVDRRDLRRRTARSSNTATLLFRI